MVSLIRLSRQSGFSGSPFSDFSVDRCNQLSLFSNINLKEDKPLFRVLNLTNILVPFLPTVNSVCSPGFRKIPGIFAGKIESAENNLEIDGIIRPCYDNH